MQLALSGCRSHSSPFCPLSHIRLAVREGENKEAGRRGGGEREHSESLKLVSLTYPLGGEERQQSGNKTNQQPLLQTTSAEFKTHGEEYNTIKY